MEQGSTIGSKLITVITVVFNRAAEMEETILSVSQQTFDDIEYIIIDGGSTDGTVDLIKTHNDKISSWTSEPDKGIYDAMNKGLSKTTGEWVYFLNAGDSFLNAYVLEQIVPDLSKSAFSVVAGKVEATDGDSMQLFPVASRIKDLSARSLFSSSFCHQALFIKRQAYLDHGGYDLNFKTFADFDVAHKIIMKERGYTKSDVVIAKYDLGGISNNWRYSVRHFEEAEKIFANHGEPSHYIVYNLRRLKAKLFYLRKSLLHIFKA